MQAITYSAYGPPEVLKFTRLKKPVPGDDEILIKIYVTTVTSGDWRVRSLHLPRGFGFIGRLVLGIKKPRQPILGTEASGIIESVGKWKRGYYAVT